MVVRFIAAVADFHARNISDAYDTVSALGSNGNIAELVRCEKLSLGADGVDELLFFRGRRNTDFTSRILVVLFLNRLSDVDCCDAEFGHFLRVKPDTHRALRVAEDFRVSDTVHAFNRVNNVLIDVVGQLNRFIFAVRRVKRHQHQCLFASFANVDAVLTNRVGKPAFSGPNSVVDFKHRIVRVGPHFERAGNADHTVGADGGFIVEQPVNTGELIFDRSRDRLCQSFGIRALIRGGHENSRRSNFRILRNRKCTPG